jgi:hypothetical protein
MNILPTSVVLTGSPQEDFSLLILMTRITAKNLYLPKPFIKSNFEIGLYMTVDIAIHIEVR